MMPPTRKIFQPVPPDVENIGKMVLDAAYRVHTGLGAGWLESVYETTMAHVRRGGGLLVETQLLLPIMFEGERIESALRLDMRVEKWVIVELKSVEAINPVYEAQLMTYLRLSGLRLGFLINFNVPHLKDGIKRMVI
jgi:GxxExxY protein